MEKLKIILILLLSTGCGYYPYSYTPDYDVPFYRDTALDLPAPTSSEFRIDYGGHQSITLDEYDRIRRIESVERRTNYLQERMDNMGSPFGRSILSDGSSAGDSLLY